MRRTVRAGIALIVFAAAVAAGLLPFGTKASADAPPQIPVDFTTSHGRPVAGRSFSGLAITNVSGLQGKAVRTSVYCDAEVGGKRLHARKTTFGTVRPGLVQTTVCSWNIPAAAAGKKLDFWHNLGSGGDHRAVVWVGTGTIGNPEISWRVAKR